jgi:hypothetical protein
MIVYLVAMPEPMAKAGLPSLGPTWIAVVSFFKEIEFFA